MSRRGGLHQKHRAVCTEKHRKAIPISGRGPRAAPCQAACAPRPDGLSAPAGPGLRPGRFNLFHRPAPQEGPGTGAAGAVCTKNTERQSPFPGAARVTAPVRRPERPALLNLGFSKKLPWPFSFPNGRTGNSPPGGERRGGGQLLFRVPAARLLRARRLPAAPNGSLHGAPQVERPGFRRAYALFPQK